MNLFEKLEKLSKKVGLPVKRQEDARGGGAAGRGSPAGISKSAQTGAWSEPSQSGQMSAPTRISSTERASCRHAPCKISDFRVCRV